MKLKNKAGIKKANFASKAVLAGMLAAASASAAEKEPDETQVHPILKAVAGVYDKGKHPLIAYGIGMGVEYKEVSMYGEIEGSVNELYGSFQFPVGRFRLGPFAYRSDYYEVSFGAGILYEIPQLNVIFSPHYLPEGKTFCYPVNWTSSAGRFNFNLGISYIPAYESGGARETYVGGEILTGLNISEGVSVFGKAFVMADANKKPQLVVLNAQGGFQLAF
ncbi:hypothetical protein JXA56_01825 [Candidatus Micrarchaeota archaeon]|nr:hypothetical protein [Candidatus Micrarchaeota archaeon]